MTFTQMHAKALYENCLKNPTLAMSTDQYSVRIAIALCKPA